MKNNCSRQSIAATGDEYLKEVPQERSAVLKQIRKLCLRELRSYKETMRYGGLFMKKIISLRPVL
ncbi:MAG: hypothetical protein ABI688_10665 [Bacteroidota bacterium]